MTHNNDVDDVLLNMGGTPVAQFMLVSLLRVQFLKENSQWSNEGAHSGFHSRRQGMVLRQKRMQCHLQEWICTVAVHSMWRVSMGGHARSDILSGCYKAWRGQAPLRLEKAEISG